MSRCRGILITIAILLSARPVPAEDLEVSPSLSASVLVPVSEFADITGVGTGLNVNFALTHLFFDNSVFMLSGGYYYMFPSAASIQSFYLPLVLLSFGYAFSVTETWQITPLIGGGLLFHIIASTSPANSDLYLDVCASLKCELALRLAAGFAVYFIPCYTIFFEQSAVGHYFSFDLGLKKSFTVKRHAKNFQNFIEPDLPCFSPNADTRKDRIRFLLKIDASEAIKEGSVQFNSFFRQ